MFGKRDEGRLREIQEELATIRLDLRGGLASVVTAISELTELDSVAVFTVRDAAGKWTLEQFHHAGSAMRRLEPRLRSQFARSAQMPMPFDPHRVPLGQRNRITDARRFVESRGAGSWHRTRMVTEVLEPLGLASHHQHRALLCDGSTFIGWFGTLHTAPPTRRQLRILGRLVTPLRDRVLLERRIASASGAQVAVDGLLARVVTPAFVVDGRRMIRDANTAGRALLDERRRAVTGDVVAAVSAKADDPAFEVMPLRCDGRAAGWIVIMRDDSAAGRISACVRESVRRWRLTRQQSRVLEMIIGGHSNAAIANELDVSERAVELHITALFDKIGVDGRAAMVAAVLLSQP